jgi:hypothetical protein
VVHLRSLISGQTHHMEHIVRSLTQTPELSDYLEDESKGGRSPSAAGSSKDAALNPRRSMAGLRRSSSNRARRTITPGSPTSSTDGKASESEKVTPEMERSFFSAQAGLRTSKRMSDISLVDVADRHLRDKTEAITNIIRNISEQCAAAVEGLQLAHNAEQEEELLASLEKHGSQPGSQSEDEEQSVRTEGSEAASEAGFDDSSYLQPSYKHSSVPPTPSLDHDRSSTSMSVNSMSTTPDRSSQLYAQGLAPKILEGDDESEKGSEMGNSDVGMISKGAVPLDNLSRPSTARIIQ